MYAANALNISMQQQLIKATLCISLHQISYFYYSFSPINRLFLLF